VTRAGNPVPPGLDPDASELVAAARAVGAPPLYELGYARARELMETMSRPPGPLMHDVTELEFDGPHGPLRVRRYQPDVGVETPGLVYFHGGGFVLGSLDSYDNATRHLARATGAVLLSVDYRLAPEHRYPVANDEALAAMAWAVEHAAELGLDPLRIGVAGDSAGGSLAASVALAARGTGWAPMLQLLINPGVDGDLERPSVREFADGPVITRDDMRWMRQTYYGPDESALPSGAVPGLVTDLSGAASAIVVTASHDPSRDGAEAYGARLRAAGVQTALLRYPGMYHGFLMRTEYLARARLALAEIGALVRVRLAA